MNSKMPKIKQILTLVTVASAGVFLYLPASALMNSNASDSQQLAQTTPPLPTEPTPPALPTSTPLTPPGGSLSTPPTLPEGGAEVSPSPMETPDSMPTPAESPSPEESPTPSSGGGSTTESAPATTGVEASPALSPGLGTPPAAGDLQKGTWLCLNNPNPACQ
jgi:hypothetical protein